MSYLVVHITGMHFRQGMLFEVVQHLSKYKKLICDIIGQNQSHVAKHEAAQICILSEDVKICQFFVFNKKEIFV